MNIIESAKTAVHQLSQAVIRNEPSIMAYTAMGGVVSTGVLAAKGGFDYAREKPESTDTYQKLGVGVKCFWPAALSGFVTIGLIFASNKSHLARNAALIALAATRDQDFNKYKERLENALGEKKTQEVRTAVSQDAVNEITTKQPEVESTGKGDLLCYDPFEGRRFRCSKFAINEAEAETNKRIMLDGGATLNDFYDFLNLENSKAGDYLGWDIDHPVRIDFDWCDGPDGSPCLVMRYLNDPTPCFR